MKILSIETSCDETGVSLVNCSREIDVFNFEVQANNLLSQVELHAEYGGVFPSLAKREHVKAIIPLVEKTLSEAGLERTRDHSKRLDSAKAFLDREPELAKDIEKIANFDTSPIDAIAVTVGPGLAPALWVGVNTARALSALWDIPLIPVNHMHGHVFSALFPKSNIYETPALALLVSGGHTELLEIEEKLNLTTIGSTRDDAIGEAFDKAARLLDLGYPGGPEISKKAEKHRLEHPKHKSELLPRPMITDSSLDVSYSGLKTALLYYLRDNPEQKETNKALLAREFEDAALDVILAKVQAALKTGKYRSLVIGGGVIANKELRKRLQEIASVFGVQIYLPEAKLTTDNSLMIAVAAFVNKEHQTLPSSADFSLISAQANLPAEQTPRDYLNSAELFN